MIDYGFKLSNLINNIEYGNPLKKKFIYSKHKIINGK